jgi:hypothetical protein
MRTHLDAEVKPFATVFFFLIFGWRGKKKEEKKIVQRAKKMVGVVFLSL